jgi:lactoylglutathione lyase
VYFVGILPEGVPYPEVGSVEARRLLMNFPGVALELTHNHGTELEEKAAYHPGNEERDGFGHIAVHCEDVYKAFEELSANGVQWKKTPDGGRMKGLAFAYDPDRYWIEIIQRPAGLFQGYNFSQTMLRVKDPTKSLPFYVNHFGMTLVKESHYGPDSGNFSLYFLAQLPPGTQHPDPTSPEASPFVKTLFNPCLELTHNHGTESDPDFVHYNGNVEPRRGFGHIGFLVDDVYQFCASLVQSGVQLQKTPDGGNMKGLAFARDPDGYWVEIIKRNGYGDDVQVCEGLP